VQANCSSGLAAISRDGRFVSFSSCASNLAAGTNGWFEVYVHDMLRGTTVLASVSTSGLTANFGNSERSALSADGRFVTFDSFATNLVAGDTNLHEDVFLRDMQAGLTTCISISSSGVQGGLDSRILGGRSISADGLRVAFESQASNLVSGDTNQNTDVFVRDIPSSQTVRVSHGSGGVQGDGWAASPTISGDGRFVIFCSSSDNLTDGDTNALPDVFVYDWRVDSTLRVSVATDGTQSDGESMPWVDLSFDGRYSVFGSRADNLDPNDQWTNDDIFLHDRGAPLPSAFCSGDGSGTPCPCQNSGIPGRGCENSGQTGGAILGWAGDSSLAQDTLQLTSSGELPSALSVLLEGSETLAPNPFGDGLSCIGGGVLRLNAVQASAGEAVIPAPGQPSISASSAARGDPLHYGLVRIYQVYYRDPDPNFCPGPSGGGGNLSSALAITWKP
jgi:Tol biopolymer transport system component